MNHKEFSEKLDAIERERGGSAPLTVRDFRMLFPAPVVNDSADADAASASKSASKSARKRG